MLRQIDFKVLTLFRQPLTLEGLGNSIELCTLKLLGYKNEINLSLLVLLSTEFKKGIGRDVLRSAGYAVFITDYVGYLLIFMIRITLE